MNIKTIGDRLLSLEKKVKCLSCNSSQSSGGIIETTSENIQSLIDTNQLIVGGLYKITGFNKNMLSGSPENPNGYIPEVLYDDGTNSGITIYVEAITTNTLSSSGWGEFYNPKYGDQTTYYNTDGTGLYGIWDGDNPDPLSVPVYVVDQVVFWGGYAWKNLTGNVGYSEDVVTLNTDDWQKLPYSNNTYYKKVIDEIKVDWNNRIVVGRINVENQIIVEFNADQYDWWTGWYTTNIAVNPILVMAWGLYSKITPEQLDNDFYGISNVKVVNGWCETVNFKGVGFLNVNCDISGIYNNYFGKDTYIDEIILNYWSDINNNTLTIGSSINNNTLTNSDIQYNTLDQYSYIEYNTLTNISDIYNNTLTNSDIQNNTLTNSLIQNNTLTNSSNIQYNTLTIGNNIYNNTLDQYSIIGSNTLTNSSDIYNNTLTNGKIQNNTLTNSSNIQFNTLTNAEIKLNNLLGGSTIHTNNLSSNSKIQGNFINQYSNIDTNTLNNSSIISNTLEEDSQITNNNLSISNIVQNKLSIFSIVDNNTLTNSSSINFNKFTNAGAYLNNFDATLFEYNILEPSSAVQSVSMITGSISKIILLQSSQLSLLSTGTMTSKTIQNLTIVDCILAENISSATGIFLATEKKVFKRADGTKRLMYYNTSDTPTIVNVDA